MAPNDGILNNWRTPLNKSPDSAYGSGAPKTLLRPQISNPHNLRPSGARRNLNLTPIHETSKRSPIEKTFQSQLLNSNQLSPRKYTIEYEYQMPSPKLTPPLRRSSRNNIIASTPDPSTKLTKPILNNSIIHEN